MFLVISSKGFKARKRLTGVFFGTPCNFRQVSTPCLCPEVASFSELLSSSMLTIGSGSLNPESVLLLFEASFLTQSCLKISPIFNRWDGMGLSTCLRRETTRMFCFSTVCIHSFSLSSPSIQLV